MGVMSGLCLILATLVAVALAQPASAAYGRTKKYDWVSCQKRKDGMLHKANLRFYFNKEKTRYKRMDYKLAGGWVGKHENEIVLFNMIGGIPSVWAIHEKAKKQPWTWRTWKAFSNNPTSIKNIDFVEINFDAGPKRCQEYLPPPD